MTSSLIDSLAEGMANVSLQDHAPNAVINRSQDSAIVHAPPSQATLLGIPQELRNKIFEYVYDVCNKPDSCIDVILFDPRTSDNESDVWDRTQAMIPLWAAPPTRTPTLVCRQLYAEMKDMQAAAIRHYWSKNVFSIDSTLPEQLPHHAYQAVKPRDFMHAEHFNLRLNDYGLEFAVAIGFEAGQWTASSDVTENCLEDILHKNLPGSRWHFQPQRPPLRRCLAAALVIFHDFLFLHLIYGRPRDELYTNSGERKILDPKAGNGLTINNFMMSTSAIAELIRASLALA